MSPGTDPSPKADPKLIRALMILAIGEAALFAAVACILWFRTR